MFVLVRKRRENSSRVKAVQRKDGGFSKLRGLAREISCRRKREFGKDGVL